MRSLFNLSLLGVGASAAALGGDAIHVSDFRQGLPANMHRLTGSFRP